MDTTELLRIVRDEDLNIPILYGDRPIENDAVVLERRGDVWTVYIAGERGGPQPSTVRTFDNESGALEHVLLKCRQWTKALHSMAALDSRRPMQRAEPLSTDGSTTVSDAIVLMLKRFPGRNDEEVLALVDESTRAAAQAIINEAVAVPMEWGQKTIIEIGQEHRAVMRQRHPELSEAAIDKLGNYFSYLVK